MKSLSSLKSKGRRFAVNTLKLAANVADTETITIGGEIYEIDSAASPGAITAGRIRVDVTAGLTPALAGPKIAAAINANNSHGLQATYVSASAEVVIFGPVAALDCTETLAGSGNAWYNATMVGGNVNDFPATTQLFSRAAVAGEVTAGVMHFVFPFQVTSAIAHVRTAAGIPVAHVGACTVSGNRVTVDNTGATDFAATDVVSVVATGH
jgi:hypothetical protein